MANKTIFRSNRSKILTILSIIVLGIALLGSLNIIDTVAWDDALEPILGVRIFMTVPRPPEAVDSGSAPADLISDEAGIPVRESSSEGDWWAVMFTTPGEDTNYIANQLVAQINSAQTSIHIASFEFDLEEVANALIAAKGRGVEVLWVTDDEYGIEADEDEGNHLFEQMEKAGIKVKDDQRGGLMHNKFWIFDRKIVWTGSTNITQNGTLLNNNNVILLESRDVAEMYEREFEEMWSDDQFGITSPSTVDQQNVKIDDSSVLVRFAAEDDVATLLAELLGRAQSEIRFMAFSFTDDDMGGSILQQAKNGVSVAGIFEQRGAMTEYSEFPFLYCNGLSVRLDGNPRTMHHKVLIIDRQIVVTGSYNFSVNADTSNDENVIMIDNSQIAAEYLKEFDRLWAESQLPDQDEVNCP
ncbi:MAG TPA: phospholipase D-like domain-containing protein [Anaerolineales bacterium]|jgi:phosphatidylserine/phosphatidylglycerophosphate/cardiolipin synthase-like enzyme|nr:phospholipase D-like domain-containing protein [Anaerolineales bacterium]